MKKTVIFILTLCLMFSMFSFTVPGNTATAASFSPGLPCDSAVVSTYYRYYNNGNPKAHGCRSDYHNGIDFTGLSGDPIRSIEAGTVVEVSYQASGFGHYIVVKHSNGLYSLYGHLKAKPLYKKGANVSKGCIIGYMGNTGNSTGTHLHLELYDPNNKGKVIDPLMTYYKNRFTLQIGSNSYRANIGYTKNDAYAKAYCTWLSTLTKNRDGDYVAPAPSGTSYNVNYKAKSSKYVFAYNGPTATGYTGRVFPKDLVTIQQVLCNGQVLKMVCPWDGGTKTIYVRTTDFFFTAQRYIDAFSGINGTKVGRVFPGDVCRLLELKNGYARILCPWDTGINREVWIKADQMY